MKYIVIFLSCMIGLILSCEKAELQHYTGGDGVYFYSIDSANYSFATQIGVVNRDTIYINMRLLGDIKDYDRPFKLKAAQGSTAIENSNFVLPEGVIKANTNTTEYPVVLINSAELKTKTLRLELQVEKNNHFPEGTTIVTSGSTFDKFKINFNDSLIKPTYWDNIQSYFGVYSDVKYKFMIDVAGFSDFSFQTRGNTELLNLKGVMKRELQDYVAQNGNLLDENNNIVTFPN